MRSGGGGGGLLYVSQVQDTGTASREKAVELILLQLSMDPTVRFQLPMDPTEIKFGETRTGASSSRNFFTITSPAKTANSINTFCRFGMTWQIQVEIILLPFQGRWCYECLLRKTFCCFGMTWQIQVEITLLPIKGRWCYKCLLTKKNYHAYKTAGSQICESAYFVL